MASTRKADQSERSPPPSREFYEGMAASSSSRAPEVGNPSADGAIRERRSCRATRASPARSHGHRQVAYGKNACRNTDLRLSEPFACRHQAGAFGSQRQASSRNMGSGESSSAFHHLH